MSSEFGKSLLQAAKHLDKPAAGAKTHAAARLAAAVSSGAATTTVAAAASATAGLKLAAIAAGTVALVLGSTAAVMTLRDRPAPQPAVVSPPPPMAERAPPPAPATPPRSAPSPSASAANAPVDPNACAMHALPESSNCSKQGTTTAAFNVVNRCNADVDVFWVDFKCDEVIHARQLRPGQTFRRMSQPTQVWRIRDHATHVLLKEFSPHLVPGAPDWDHKDKTAVRTLPDLVIGNGPTLDESKPAFCSAMGYHTKFTLENARDEQVVLFWVSDDCEEQYWQRLEPTKKLTVTGRNSDAWRVRSARTGELVLDIPPEESDYTETISVP